MCQRPSAGANSTIQSGSKCGLAPPGAAQPGPRFPYVCGRRLQRLRERCSSCVPRKGAVSHAPSLQPSWITALRRAICLLMLRMRRFGHRFRPWRRQIFLRTVGQMSVKRVSQQEGPPSAVLHRRTQDLRGFVDRPVEEGSNTRNISAALGVAAGMDRHAIRLHAQGQQR